MIPAFDHNGVLPPYLSDPRHAKNMAPYASSTVEICQKWGDNGPRREILRGLLNLRRDLAIAGATSGFQWLDGSFMEDCENQRQRPPGDIDVVTFYTFSPPLGVVPANVMTALSNRAATKTAYRVDHILVPLVLQPVDLVDQTRFWYGLFSHRKADAVWKGMLQVPLNTAAEDATALGVLNGFGTP